MQFGIIGSGSWATALAKIITDNGNTIHWWVRNEESIQYLQKRRHNPHYLSGAYFNPEQLFLHNKLAAVVEAADVLIIAVPSAYVAETIQSINPIAWKGKKIMSAVKGVLPSTNQLVNDFLFETISLNPQDYFTILGPCHAEEVAAEKLSYLTFSGIDENATAGLASYFTTDYINTIVNTDIIGVQYAAVLKNIYALGAGIAHGLDYGDNFQSVYIAAAADEMVSFLKKISEAEPNTVAKLPNYAASVYLGDLLVTCYSLYSRNRTFGNMLGKGYSVKAAQLELNMVAEGYNASKCIYIINQSVGASMPIAATIYKILWEHVPPSDGFRMIEKALS